MADFFDDDTDVRILDRYQVNYIILLISSAYWLTL